jgi:hypothetical protein
MIAVEIDGITLSVPIDPGNRHYQALLASGLAIADYAVDEAEQAAYTAAIAGE